MDVVTARIIEETNKTLATSGILAEIMAAKAGSLQQLRTLKKKEIPEAT